jgi:hypothetical protein
MSIHLHSLITEEARFERHDEKTLLNAQVVAAYRAFQRVLDKKLGKGRKKKSKGRRGR